MENLFSNKDDFNRAANGDACYVCLEPFRDDEDKWQVHVHEEKWSICTHCLVILERPKITITTKAYVVPAL
jgi:hypothetical protein